MEVGLAVWLLLRLLLCALARLSVVARRRLLLVHRAGAPVLGITAGAVGFRGRHELAATGVVVVVVVMRLSAVMVAEVLLLVVVMGVPGAAAAEAHILLLLTAV